MEEVFRVEGRVLAPLVGGYNGEPYSDLIGYEPLRPNEFKGKWRWWLRTAVVSALGPSSTYKEAEKYVNEILGSTSNPSPYQLILRQGECGGGRIFLNRASRIPRIKQRYVRVRGEGISIPVSCRFSLSIMRTSKIGYMKERLALRALTILLLLDGIGSASNRGFGSIVPAYIRYFEPASSILSEMKTHSDPNELRELVTKFIRETVELAIETTGGTGHSNLLPKVPSLSYLYFDVREGDGISVPLLLERIGSATLKLCWKRNRCWCTSYNNGFNPINYHTWILGLPRGRLSRGGVIHGYEHRGVDRRQSSIKLKIMEIGRRRLVFITGMPSLDWPLNELRYKRPALPPEGVLVKQVFGSLPNQKVVERVFDCAWNCVRRCLS